MVRTILIVPVVFLIVLAGCIGEPAATTGTVQVASSPSGAQIYLDSQYRGSTPSTLTGIGAGNHTLELRYTGYEPWSATMAVAAGSNNVFVALEQIPAGSPGSAVTVAPTATLIAVPSLDLPASITLNVGKDPMIVGDSQVFSGTATGCNHVLVNLYGPGIYTNGIQLDYPAVNGLGAWKYTWNPGSAVLPGTYTVIVTDPTNTISERRQFLVVGGGKVTVATNSYAAAKGDTLVFSGMCTTGASSVQLVLAGPERYSGGVDLGTFSVQANKNWNFKFTTDPTMPTGVYTLYVYDVPKTTSGTVQFTVGYKSS